MRRPILVLPLLLLALFALAVGWRLANPPDTVIRSRLAGQPLPAFALLPATPGKPGLSTSDFADGRPRLINVFASWCVPCIAEAPLLLELKRSGVAIDAIAIRDRPEDVAEFLARNGDPFDRIGADRDSRVQLALGSSGVPETFVVDGRGVIRGQHVGPIERSDLAALRQALAAAR